MKVSGFIFPVLLLMVAASSVAAPNDSRFERTALALQNSAGPLPGTFAQSAITILMEIYLAEADLARREQTEMGGDVKLASWVVAVDQYSHQLDLMLEQIDSGSRVEIRSTSNSLAVVAVGGRSVILSHPRADQQAAFEHRVVSDFCAQKSCDSLLKQPERLDPVPVSAPIFTPDWSFTTAGPVCSRLAIRVQFDSNGGLADSRGLCRQFFQEISSLATEIRWQESQGVITSWESIAIRQTPHTPEHIVTLTSSGDVTLLPLPLLYSSEGLLLALVPWLRAQLAGAANPALLLDAEDYGWN